FRRHSRGAVSDLLRRCLHPSTCETRHRIRLQFYIVTVLKRHHRTVCRNPFQESFFILEPEVLRVLHLYASMKDELHPVLGLKAKRDTIISPEAETRSIPLHMLRNL